MQCSKITDNQSAATESGAPTVELELDPSKLLAQASTSGAGEGSLCDEAAGVWARVNGALLDDLNTPVAIAALSEPLKIVNDLLFTKKGKKVRFPCAPVLCH